MGLQNLFSLILKGGSGSGNFGHRGRKGQRGGSASEGGGFFSMPDFAQSLGMNKNQGGLGYKGLTNFGTAYTLEENIKAPGQVLLSVYGSPKTQSLPLFTKPLNKPGNKLTKDSYDYVNKIKNSSSLRNAREFSEYFESPDFSGHKSSYYQQSLNEG